MDDWADLLCTHRDLHPELAALDPSLMCDPFAEPGFLVRRPLALFERLWTWLTGEDCTQHVDEREPLQTKWIPYSPSCEPAPDWLSLIARRDLEATAWLANRTILVLGDSVDRNGLHHLAEMLGLPRYCVPYDDYSKKGVVPPGWDERGIPWVVEIPWLNTYFTNGFMYGLVSRRAPFCASCRSVAGVLRACLWWRSLTSVRNFLGRRGQLPPATRLAPARQGRGPHRQALQGSHRPAPLPSFLHLHTLRS